MRFFLKDRIQLMLNWGLFFGFMLPVLVFVAYYWGGGNHLMGAIGELALDGLNYSIFALSAIPNLLIFHYYLRKNHLWSAYSVMVATVIWAIVILLARWLMS